MLNQINIIGNIGRIESRATPSGLVVAAFSVAVSSKKKGEDNTTWFNCVAFEKTAELCLTYLRKGQKVFVSGSMDEKKYTGKDGSSKTSWSVIAKQVVFLSPKDKEQSEHMPSDIEFHGLSSNTVEIDLDNIPF